ncbi:MAG: hypothetical protein RJA25_915 [Bacteroidota bacterium]|jgi:hypothetical protein
MKKLEIKLDNVVKKLAFEDFPNKQELLDGHGDLKKLFNSSFSQESLLEIIRELKANAFYRQFKLDADPQFLKALVKKVTDFKVIEELLKFSEINYSQQEKRVLRQRRNILISLIFLEKNFHQEAKHFNDDFIEVYFEELEQLKKIFTTESISIKDIDWFFQSDLFQFVSKNPEFLDVELADLFKMLLEETEIKTIEDFIKHKQLLEKAQEENLIDYKKFYAVLSSTNKQLAENLRKSLIAKDLSNSLVIPVSTCNSSIFEKFSELKKLSPIAKKALLNNLKECNDSPHLKKFKR